MSNPLQRLRARWQMGQRFAAAAQQPREYGTLFLAGLARLRPFAGPSAYARLGRMFGSRVAPRIRAAGGHRLELDLRDATDLTIFEEIFLDGIYPLERVPFTPDTIVDCGGCAGFFTVLANSRYPRAQLHVFEPNPSNITRLKRNLSLNRIPATVHEAAVASNAGRARFSGEGFGGQLDTVGGVNTFEVEVVALTDFLAALKCEKLLLKIDIEGAEAELLPSLGRVLPQCTALFLETHHSDAVWQAYLQPLIEVGFRREEIRRRHDTATGENYVEHILLRS